MSYYDKDSSRGQRGSTSDQNKRRQDQKRSDKELSRQAKEREKLRKTELEFQKEKFKTQQRNRTDDERAFAQRERDRSKRDKSSQVQKNPDVQPQQGLPPGAEPYEAPTAPSAKPAPVETIINPIPEKGQSFLGKAGNWIITSTEIDKDEGSFKAENQETYDLIFMNYKKGKWRYKLKNNKRNVVKISSPNYIKVFKTVVDVLDADGELFERTNVNEQKFRSLIKEMTKKEFEKNRTNIISRMLDNPDENEIYPTTKAFAEFDDLFDKLTGNKKQSWAQMNEQKFRSLIRSFIKELIIFDDIDDIEEVTDDIDEVSATANIAGYQSPYAFTGKGKKQKTNNSKMKKNAEQLGYKIVGELPEADEVYDSKNPVYEHFVQKVYTKVVEVLKEGRRGHYHAFRDDEGTTTKQKIGNSLFAVRNKLSEIEKSIDMVLRLKNEMGMRRDEYWKRSERALRKIEEKLSRISRKMKEF